MFAEDVLGISLTELSGGRLGDDCVVESAAEILMTYEASFDIGAVGETDGEETLEAAADAAKLSGRL